MNPRVEFDLSILNENIQKLKNETNNIHFLFPVKCCKNNRVLNIIVKNGFGFDVSNNNEFKVVEKLLNDQFVSASGPLSYELNHCHYKNIHVVANNLNSFIKGNGIRINFNSNKNFEYSRFGEDYQQIEEDIRNEVNYVHFHNSDYRDLNKCEEIYKEIKNIMQYFPNLKILNIGGHLEDLSIDEGLDYLNNVRFLIPSNIALYVEVGDFLFKNSGTLYCKVVDVRNDKDKQIVTLNFSKMANQRWAYPIYKTGEKNKKLIRTVFYGCSCCETDIYLETNSYALQVGDEIKFGNISPYSYEWNTAFNGVNKLEYIFK